MERGGVIDPAPFLVLRRRSCYLDFFLPPLVAPRVYMIALACCSLELSPLLGLNAPARNFALGAGAGAKVKIRLDQGTEYRIPAEFAFDSGMNPILSLLFRTFVRQPLLQQGDYITAGKALVKLVRFELRRKTP